MNKQLPYLSLLFLSLYTSGCGNLGNEKTRNPENSLQDIVASSNASLEIPELSGLPEEQKSPGLPLFYDSLSSIGRLEVGVYSTVDCMVLDVNKNGPFFIKCKDIDRDSAFSVYFNIPRPVLDDVYQITRSPEFFLENIFASSVEFLEEMLNKDTEYIMASLVFRNILKKKYLIVLDSLCDKGYYIGNVVGGVVEISKNPHITYE